jgi:hypothetical protein
MEKVIEGFLKSKLKIRTRNSKFNRDELYNKKSNKRRL